MSWTRTLRRWAVAQAVMLGIVFVTSASWAHDVPPSKVALDIGRRVIDVKLTLQLSELGAALSLPLADQASTVLPQYEPRIARYIGERLAVTDLEGRGYDLRILSMEMEHTSNANWVSNDWLVVRAALDAPPGASTEAFALDDTVILQRVLSHEAFVYVEHDLRNGVLGDKPVLVGVVGFGRTHLVIDGSSGSWWKGFVRMFSLGMEHISTGTDHLLFLLVLLLPAPLIASRRRWGGRKSLPAAFRSTVMIAGGFTLGHSLTLAFASAGWVHVPPRLVEVLIALSVLVSSVHAWRPVFAGREVWVASSFGLVHGLAFASMLSGLSFDGTTLAISLLGFNLGIEWMQLLVIAAALPLLLALGATRVYAAFRSAGAAFAGACASGWIAERAFLAKNPLAPIVDWLAHLPAWVVGSVCAASCVSFAWLLIRPAVTARPSARVRRRAPNLDARSKITLRDLA